jgi:hypothetical protein
VTLGDTFHVLKFEVKEIVAETSQRPGATESQQIASKFLQFQNTFDWLFSTLLSQHALAQQKLTEIKFKN